MSQAGLIDIEQANPQIPTSFVTDDGIAIPIVNVLEILGVLVPASGIPIETAGSGNTVSIKVQLATGSGAPDINNAGLASFDSADFSVDANGFVSLSGSSTTEINVDASTPPGTDPVVPLAGVLNFTGAQVAAGVVGTNVLRTNSLAAHTVTYEIQRSAATLTPVLASNGVCHFDSAAFDVDSSGFVQLNGGGIGATAFDVQANTAPGTDPVVPTAAGVVTVNGAAVANHSVVLETRSRAANAFNLEVQYATTAAVTDATKSGVAHFDSAEFTVDANGFVSLTGSGAAITTINGNTGSATGSTVTIRNAATNGTITFTGSGSTLTFTTDDSNANLAIGGNSGSALGAGVGNLLFGNSAGSLISTSDSNTIIGYQAGQSLTGAQNVVLGTQALSNANGASSNNVILGYQAGSAYGTTESSNILISSAGVLSESNVMHLGTQGSSLGQVNKCFIAGINGNTVSNTQMVTINSSTGQLGTQSLPTAFTWINVTGTSATLVQGNAYQANNAGLVTLTMPSVASSTFGDTIKVGGFGSGGWAIQCVATQLIHYGATATSAAGTLISTNRYDQVELVCSSTTTEWFVRYVIGNLGNT